MCALVEQWLCCMQLQMHAISRSVRHSHTIASATASAGCSHTCSSKNQSKMNHHHHRDVPHARLCIRACAFDSNQTVLFTNPAGCSRSTPKVHICGVHGRCRAPPWALLRHLTTMAANYAALASCAVTTELRGSASHRLAVIALRDAQILRNATVSRRATGSVCWSHVQALTRHHNTAQAERAR